jgi:SAM-dependent methyltransferase
MESAGQAANASEPPGAPDFDNPTQALVYDLTQPCVVDSGGFVEAIGDEIRRQRSARILDPGCGTGLQALPILDLLNEIEYPGIDRSPAMVAIFRQKLDGLAKRRADAVLLSQFLQYLPLEFRSNPLRIPLPRRRCSRVAWDLAGPGGRVFIIEDVMGEDDAGHGQLSSEWDRAVIARNRENWVACGRARLARPP